MAFERTVKDVMCGPVVTTTEDAAITDVVKILMRWHISGVPVVDDDGSLLGVVTEDDIMNCALSGYAADTQMKEVMVTEVATHSPDTLVEEAVNFFAASGLHRVPVVENGRLLGVVCRRDIIRELDRNYDQLVKAETDMDETLDETVGVNTVRIRPATVPTRGSMGVYATSA